MAYRKTMLMLALILIAPNLFADKFIATAIKTLEYCYESRPHLGSELAQCMTNTLRNVPNPHALKIYLEGYLNTNSKPFSLFFWNPTGLKVSCEVVAEKKLIINKCNEQQLLPLINEQSTPVLPPK